MYDIIIIGAGPAGVSAALYAKARGKTILLLEKERIGGLISHVSQVSHYASVGRAETGASFAQKLEEQLNYSGITYKIEEALELKKRADAFYIKTDNAEYTSKKVICACGSRLKELPLAQEFKTFHWPFGREQDLKGKTVIVNGGSDGACKEALYIAQYAKAVHIVQNQERLLCIDEFKKQIEAHTAISVHTSCELAELTLKNRTCVKALLGKEEIADAEGIEICVQIGQNGNSELLRDFATIENSFLAEDISAQTAGLFFAGDIRKKDVRQIATAVSDGCRAGILACK